VSRYRGSDRGEWIEIGRRTAVLLVKDLDDLEYRVIDCPCGAKVLCRHLWRHGLPFVWAGRCPECGSLHLVGWRPLLGRAEALIRSGAVEI